MFASAVLFAALASTALSAPLQQRDDASAAPSHWAHGYLENYAVYHERYLALSCQTRHNTVFFDDCCHPLLSIETLADDREAYCTPNTTESSSAAEYTATATVTGTADAEAATQYCSAKTNATVRSTSTSTWSAAEASSTSASASASVTVEIEAKGQWAQPSPSAEPTIEWVVPTTTSTTEVAAETTQASSASSSSMQTGGHATYFYQNGNAGACGQYHSDSDKVVAIDGNGWWQTYGVQSDLCGRWVNIKNTNNGKTVTAMIADVCPTCVSDNSLDLSFGAFTAIASEGDGMVPIEWSFA